MYMDILQKEEKLFCSVSLSLFAYNCCSFSVVETLRRLRKFVEIEMQRADFLFILQEKNVFIQTFIRSRWLTKQMGSNYGSAGLRLFSYKSFKPL